MPTRTTMTIVTLYNYDPTIFDDFSVPPAVLDSNGNVVIPAADLQTAIDTILIDNATLELMYPDADFVKYAVKNFSKINANKWKKLWYTENISYDPIANVDAEEKEIIDRDITDVKNTGSYQGFNSSGFKDVSKNDGGSKEDVTTTKTRHGNIGVTSTQQLIESERDVADFSLYKQIAEDFKNAFCCLVY